MFTLGDAGVTFTLGDSGGIVTRGDDGVTVRTASCGGAILGSSGFAMALSNSLARSTMACFWASPNWENGVAGDGLVRAYIMARASTMDALTEDVFGTGHWCGKIALFWRCARHWYLEHRVGVINSVREQDLNTICRTHGGAKCSGRRSFQK